MDIIYPFTASGFAGYVVCKLVWRLIVRSGVEPLPPFMMEKIKRIVEADIMIGFTELVVLFLLAMLTGSNPNFLGKLISIDDYRQYVILSRLLMGISLYYSIGVHVSAFIRYVQWRKFH